MSDSCGAFAAHLISFSDRGKVLVSPSVTEEEKKNNLVLRREWTRGMLSAEGAWRFIAEFLIRRDGKKNDLIR